MGSKPLVRPPRLARGSRVALVAPAGPLLERDDITRAEVLCRALDYEPVVAPHAGGHYGYFSGTDEDRLADLNGAFRATRNRRRLVPPRRVRRHPHPRRRGLRARCRPPRPVIGYSDITALLAGVIRRAGLVAFHGPTARAQMPAFSRRHFARVLAEPGPAGALEPLPSPATCCCRRRTAS